MEFNGGVQYRLQDIIDIKHFLNLQDRLNEIYSFPSAIIDNDGNILTATAWQDVCTKFYRTCSVSEKECIKSDQYITSHLHEANPAVSYVCPHGLIDNATPIIIDGAHLGNFFTGQFFLKAPDLQFYKDQAKKYGFDEAVFIEAVKKVPVWSMEQLNSYLFFIKGLIAIIAESGLKNLREVENRKQIELSEKRLSAVVQTTKDGIWIANPDGYIIDVNEAACTLSGYTREELLQLHISDIDDHDKSADVMRRMKQIITDGSGLFETKHRRKDGSTLDVEVSVTYIPLESAQLVCFCRDISERKRTEEALKSSQNRLKLATMSAQLGIWDWDIVNNKMVWDDEMFRLYGVKEKQSDCGIEIWKTGLHPDDKEYAWNECQAALRGDKKYDIEFRVRHPDGTIRCIKAQGIVLRNEKGDPIRMLGVNHDITESKRLEDEMQKNQKLESLGILAGGIAHDFNNLLGGIYGYMESAIEIVTDKKVHEIISSALNTIDRGRHLTQQLLTFAKGGVPIKTVAPLFPYIIEIVQFALSGSNVTCTFDVDKDLKLCNFDKNQLAQVIDNMVINAKQAMLSGGTIEVLARNAAIKHGEHPLLTKGDYIKISIRDHGIGIPQELLSKIFDPFFTTKATGHGLGLATCYSIIKRHDGCIEVDSVPGGGSTFHIFLPASKESVINRNSTIKTTHTGQGIFIVMDDEEVMRDTISSILQSFGYSVLGAENGLVAIKMLSDQVASNRNVAAMILDLTIPGGLGGKDIIQKIRKIRSDIPVFVTSGYAEDPVMAQPVEYSFTASICKPFRKSELAEMLNRYISH